MNVSGQDYKPGLQADCNTFIFPTGFSMPMNFIMTLPAPKNSGKSTFIKTFLHCDMCNYYNHIVIVCPTLKLNRDYDEFADDPRFRFLSNPLDADLRSLFTKQYDCKKAVKTRENLRLKMATDSVPTPQILIDQSYPAIRMPKTLLIVDDCLDSGIMSYGAILDTYAARGRHSDLAVMATTQRFKGISNTLRINSDFVVVFTPYSVVECEKFFEEFVSQSDRKELRLLLKSIFKEPFHFIFVDNTLRSYSDKLFVSTAEDFVLGILDPIHLPEPMVLKRKATEEPE